MSLGHQHEVAVRRGAESPAGRSRDRSGRRSGEEPGYGKWCLYIELAPADVYRPFAETSAKVRIYIRGPTSPSIVS
jgi:hypothetical protein